MRHNAKRAAERANNDYYDSSLENRPYYIPVDFSSIPKHSTYQLYLMTNGIDETFVERLAHLTGRAKNA